MLSWKVIYQIKSNSIVLCIIALVLSASSVLAEAAVSFSILHRFADLEGSIYPNGYLAEGKNGWLYGTTNRGSGNSDTTDGVAFKIKPDGTSFTIIYKFDTNQSIGGNPMGGLILGSDGNFYGVTTSSVVKRPDGLSYRAGGSIYKMTPAGRVTILHIFNAFNDAFSKIPHGTYSPPIQGADGNLYGTTRSGGDFSVGTIYRLNPVNKQFTVLHHFKDDITDGRGSESSLTLGKDGFLYGLTRLGGINDDGTAFKISPNGSGYKVLFNFSITKGIWPEGRLLQGSDGNFYGTTSDFGPRFGDKGTVFKMSPIGVLKTIKRFNWPTQFSGGGNPTNGVVQDRLGNLYGMTKRGGDNSVVFQGYGVIFKLTPSGTYSVIKTMDNINDGSFNQGIAFLNSSLFVHSNGLLYGVAPVGGSTNGDGTIFGLDIR